ncbi:MAG: Do family serine endopeptidase [Hyphomicrobiales bacterium]|nr:Do family serine endopeptidase [Hyphomicrobiales bacterium]
MWGVPDCRSQVPFSAGDGSVPSLAPVLRTVTSAVVNISVSSPAPAEENPLLRDPFFRRFFRLPPQQNRSPPRMSAGSGVIVDAANGYVLTNHHVVASGSEILVTLKDRRRLTAKLLGSDPGTDIALLQVEAKNLTAVKFGDSEALEVGDFVIAIGNPFGLGQTVTSGIVSALGRTGLNIEGYEDFIQTDASINPGNSGGALITLSGELIGINTAILAPSGGNVGIGFAVPSNMVSAVMDQLVRFGEVRRGRLGVTVQDVTPDIAEALELVKGTGALVTNVESGSPAEDGDLQPGDLITEINGRRIDTATDLRNQVGLVPVGEVLNIKLLRGGKWMTKTVQIEQTNRRPDGSYDPAGSLLEGVLLRNLAPGMPYYGRVEGVMVDDVAQGSHAWRAGLQSGDVIVAVNRRVVESVDDIEAIISTRPRAVALNIIRGRARIFIVIQ